MKRDPKPPPEPGGTKTTDRAQRPQARGGAPPGPVRLVVQATRVTREAAQSVNGRVALPPWPPDAQGPRTRVAAEMQRAADSPHDLRPAEAALGSSVTLARRVSSLLHAVQSGRRAPTSDRPNWPGPVWRRRTNKRRSETARTARPLTPRTRAGELNELVSWSVPMRHQDGLQRRASEHDVTPTSWPSGRQRPSPTRFRMGSGWRWARQAQGPPQWRWLRQAQGPPGRWHHLAQGSLGRCWQRQPQGPPGERINVWGTEAPC